MRINPELLDALHAYSKRVEIIQDRVKIMTGEINDILPDAKKIGSSRGYELKSTNLIWLETEDIEQALTKLLDYGWNVFYREDNVLLGKRQSINIPEHQYIVRVFKKEARLQDEGDTVSARRTR